MKMLILFIGLLTTLASDDNSNSKACLWKANKGLPYGQYSGIKTIQAETDTFDKCVEECEADANCHGFGWFKEQGYGCALTTHNAYFADNTNVDYYNLVAKRDCTPLIECEAEYVGCYIGAEGHMKFGPKKGSYDLQSCNDACKEYTYFGIEEHDDCYCGETLYTDGKRPDSECEEFGDPWNGGTNRVEIYKTCAQSESTTTKSFEYGTMDVMGVTYLAAVQTDGDIEVKGHNSHGVPLDANVPTGKYKAVTGGTYHACGLKSDDNKVDCWGSVGWAAGNEPKDVAFRHIDSGCNGACGIRMDNSQLECWADVFCADATCKWISDMRTDVKGVAVDYVSCGCYSCCAVLSSDSTIKCWHDPNNYWATMIEHPHPDTAYKLVEVGLHIIGIKTDGLVDVWGNFNTEEPPADIKFKKVKNLWGMVCGIKESNSAIYCWDYTDVNYPNILRGEVMSGAAFKDLAVGHHFVCGVRVDNSKIQCEGVWHYTAHFQSFHDTYLGPYEYTAAGGSTITEVIDDLSGWSTTVNDDCPEGSVVGGNGYSGTVISKAFTAPSSQCDLTVSLNFWQMASWDDELGEVIVNGQTIWSQTIQHAAVETSVCGERWSQIIPVSGTVTLNSATFSIEAKAHLNTPGGDESFGISDVKLEYTCGATESVSYTYEKTQTAELDDGRSVSMGLLTDEIFCNYYQKDDGSYVTYIDISTHKTRDECVQAILDNAECDTHWMAYEQGPRHGCRCYPLEGGPWSWDAENKKVDPFDPVHCYAWPENEIWYLTVSEAEPDTRRHLGRLGRLLSTSYSRVSAEMDAI